MIFYYYIIDVYKNILLYIMSNTNSPHSVISTDSSIGSREAEEVVESVFLNDDEMDELYQQVDDINEQFQDVNIDPNEIFFRNARNSYLRDHAIRQQVFFRPSETQDNRLTHNIIINPNVLDVSYHHNITRNNIPYRIWRLQDMERPLIFINLEPLVDANYNDIHTRITGYNDDETPIYDINSPIISAYNDPIVNVPIYLNGMSRVILNEEGFPLYDDNNDIIREIVNEEELHGTHVLIEYIDNNRRRIWLREPLTTWFSSRNTTEHPYRSSFFILDENGNNFFQRNGFYNPRINSHHVSSTTTSLTPTREFVTPRREFIIHNASAFQPTTSSNRSRSLNDLYNEEENQERRNIRQRTEPRSSSAPELNRSSYGYSDSGSSDEEMSNIFRSLRRRGGKTKKRTKYTKRKINKHKNTKRKIKKNKKTRKK